MGERYQIHVKFKFADETEELVSVHLQWCWGVHIIRNLNRLLTTLNKTSYKHLGFEDLNDYVVSILNVNKDLDGNFYPYGVYRDEEPYKTFEGDSNHGWAVILCKVNSNGKVKVLSRFYDENGKEKTNDNLWEDCKSEFEYNKWHKKGINKIKKLFNKRLFNNTKTDLQKEFNESVYKYLKEKGEEEREISP